jgi:hypothetical protein
MSNENAYKMERKESRPKAEEGKRCLPEKKRKAKVRQRSAWVSICFDDDFCL